MIALARRHRTPYPKFDRNGIRLIRGVGRSRDL